jgi:hypothetical protein
MSSETKAISPDWKPPGTKRRSWRRWSLFLCFLMLFAWAYCYLGTILIQEKNTTRTGNFQALYIEATYQAASFSRGNEAEPVSITSRFTRGLPQVSDGLVDPLWPWLASIYADEPPDILFEKGKWLNMLLSCSILVLLGLGAAQAFSFSGAAALILMGGFGVILERSTYYSADAIYLLLIVLAWLCALSLIRQNHLWLYGIFGVLLGWALLAKSPVWPLFAGFLVMSVVRTIVPLAYSKRNSAADNLWSQTNQLVGLAIFFTAFLLVTGPRMTYLAREYEDPFFNISQYMVWLDSPAEAMRFQESVRESGVGEIPEADRPGLSRFVRQKGFGELFHRGWEGGLAQLQSSMFSRQGWILFYTFAVFCIVAGIHRWAMWKQNEETWRVRGTSARWMLFFLASVFALSVFYAGIGNPVVQNNAIMTALFLPILLTFIWISERYRRQLQRTRYEILANRIYSGLMVIPIGWISFRIFQAIQTPVAG